jgi:response regulator NasT
LIKNFLQKGAELVSVNIGKQLEAPEHHPRVLVVDDDQVILFTIGDALRRAGYEVTEAASAEEALKLIPEQQPDIALLDVSMPGISGIDLAQQLRAETEVPFMFLSAFDDRDIVRLAAETGALGYLVKPVLPQQIIPSIEAGLARAEEIRELRKTESKLREIVHSAQHASMAAGVLMERNRLDRLEAFQALRSHARNQRKKLGDVAGEILDSAERLNAPARKEPPKSG